MKIKKIFFTYLLFLILVIYSGYLYSIRFDYMPWGSSNTDGLFFLTFYIIIFPTMVLISILNYYNLKKESKSNLRIELFFYTFIIAFPSIDTNGHQFSLGIGLFMSFIIAIVIIYKIFQTLRKNY